MDGRGVDEECAAPIHDEAVAHIWADAGCVRWAADRRRLHHQLCAADPRGVRVYPLMVLTRAKRIHPYVIATLARQADRETGAGCSPMSPHHRYQHQFGGEFPKQMLGSSRAVDKENPMLVIGAEKYEFLPRRLKRFFNQARR